MTKLCSNVSEALAGVLKDGARIMVGGFGLCGNPEALIEAVATSGVRDLTLMSNNSGNQGLGLATWLKAGIVRKVICTYIGNNEDLHALMREKKVDVDVLPQGTFVERMRAAGAGIPAFFTPTGVGTIVAEGKETRTFDGRPYLLEHALHADIALVRARTADPFGNLRFYGTARNFSPVMATAARVTIAEVDQLVELGDLKPDDIHLPGLFTQRIVHVPEHANVIEYLTTRPAAEKTI